ncbi:MAG: glycosyltransferase [Patescibacteria group bacterium]|nr:glycosyltransferase [Patescibacteria group bacterium]
MLSIVIPTLNEEKYLGALLDLIKKQSFLDYEIIVSDGLSEDKTLEIAQKYNCKIVIGEKDKRHPSIQRNLGAKIAAEKYILFLDADTRFYDQNFFQKIISDFEKRRLGVAGFYMDFESKKFFYKFYYCFYNFFTFLAQYIRPIGLGAAIIVKKEIHDKIGGFREDLFIGEDQYYCDQAARTSKFRLIKKTKIFFSIRRFEKDGRWKLFFKILYGTLYVLLFGPIKKKIMQYDFGKY